MSESEANPRRWIWIAAAALALILIGVWVVAVIASAGEPPKAYPTETGAQTSQPAQTSTPTPTGTSIPTSTPTQPGTDVLPELPPVAPDTPVTTDDGLVVSVVKAEAVEGEAVAPGDIAGPAVRYTIEIVNKTDKPFDLAYTVVNGYIGEDRKPAGNLIKPGGSPFEGTIAPGKTARGVYIFSVPVADRSMVTVTVDYGAGIPAVVFQGAAPRS
jgi:hypothetical protein